MIFEMKHITKTYGSVVANDDVSLHLNEGEILSIVGENGAGKSTIMKILYGLERPDEGEILVRGQLQRFHNPSDAMTVAENIVFKNELKKGPFMDMAAAVDTVRQLSDRYGLKIDPKAKIADCPVGLRQRVEILKILYQNADIIIFDEPSAVLTPLEVEALLETIRGLAKAGKSIVLITHKLQEVMAVSDRVYVMRQGRVVAERMAADTNMEELAVLMVGHPLASYDIDPPKPGRTLLVRQDEAPFSRRGIVNQKSIRDYAVKLIRDFNVKASSPAQKMRELSGGNAQKLIVAREMSLDTPVLICCEPTRGIDIGAMEAIHRRMLEKRDQGAGILLVSSELTEIMSLSDRIYVIFEGRIVGEFTRGSMDDRHLGLLMVGGRIDNE